MNIDTLFFELIRVAIGTQEGLSILPSNDEWRILYNMAKKQSLVGVCFAGLQKLGADSDNGFAKIGINESLYFEWMGNAFSIQERNDEINKRSFELQQKLNHDGFRSCILKGQGVGSLYGDLSVLRQSGDIDIWIDAERKDLIEYVRQSTSKDETVATGLHVEFPLFDDIEVEAHFTPTNYLSPILGKRKKLFFESQKSHQMKHKVVLESGQEIIAPDNVFQSIHILNHAFGHFLFEGIGLRQLMDFFFVMKQPFSVEEKARILTTIKRFGMYPFAQGVAYILEEVFGTNESFIPTDEKLGKRILRTVMDEGNFGKYDKNRDKKKMGSSWYRFWYHNIRMWKYFDIAPLTIAMSPIARIYEYFWRVGHGYLGKE